MRIAHEEGACGVVDELSKEHTLKEDTVQKLLKISAATIDRVLSTFKVKGERYGMRAL